MNLYDVGHESKASFNTYAHWHIGGEIKNFMKQTGTIIRIPGKKQHEMEYWNKMVQITFENQDYVHNSN